MSNQNEQITQIPIENIILSKDNRRIGGFNKEKLDQLAESIKAVGVQQPAVVRKIKHPTATMIVNGSDGDFYEIVAGERRFRASMLAELETLPCVVRDLDDVSVLKVRTIENLQREDVHPLDEANGFIQLLGHAGYTPETVAKEIGKSVSYVHQRIRLLSLIPLARKMLIDGTITTGHAIQIARLREEQQSELIGSYPFKRGMSVSELGEHIIEHVVMDLSKTSFKKDDADLLPKYGSCTTCTKRTGNQPALFADMSKKDYCLHHACFEAKLNALVAKNMAAIADQEHLFVSDDYGIDSRDKTIPKGTLDRSEWEACHPGEEGAVRCLLVTGVNRGRLTWGKKRIRKNWSGDEATPQQKAAAARKKLELQITRDVRRKTWDAIFNKITSDIPKEIPLELLRIIVSQTWARLWHDAKTAFANVEGWEKPKKKANDYSNGREAQGLEIISGLNRYGLVIFLAKLGLIQTLEVNDYNPSGNVKPLHDTARAIGLDPKAIEADARKIIAANAKLKAQGDKLRKEKKSKPTKPAPAAKAKAKKS